ncbi:MAG: beta-ketoacyl-ACP synthase II [Acidobacteria bacterium]|nr:beta-ketoacyl-ACP synthase II [Acidobacteriota bacterium]
MNRRVVVTGIGMITPVGLDTETTWAALLRGENGVGPITKFDATDYGARIAGEVRGFDPLQFVEKRDLKKMDLHVQYAIAAARNAWEMADVEGAYEPERIGTLIGSGIGGLNIMQKFHAVQIKRGAGKVSPFFIPGLIVNLASGWVSIIHNLKGPNSAVCTACSTGNHALGDAYRIIQRGEADAMVAGGSEGVVCSLAVDGFAAMRALSTRNDEPERASRPFDADRDGFILGEGAGLMVLEAEETALARGATIMAEVAGYGMSSDAFHLSAPPEDGDGAIRVMQATLADAGLTPEDIDYVNAHGTSTPVGDKAEVNALKAVFGDHLPNVPVSSTKSMMGHLLGAAGGVESGITVLALRDGKIPPTMNYETPDPECDIDVVPNEVRDADLDVALTNSFGFGGTNAALAFRRYRA